eukprot:m.51528 g.51528  ORF g.51528 m.51528 type:complete len:557 (-) comp16444_c0_seq1:280-1950(-)
MSDGLPPGWAMAMAPNGTPYYYNSATQVTQWTKPAGGGLAAPPSVPATAAGGYGGSSNGGYSSRGGGGGGGERRSLVRVIEAYPPYWYLSCSTAFCTAKVYHSSATSVTCGSCGSRTKLTACPPASSATTGQGWPSGSPQHRYRLKLRVVDPVAQRIFTVVFFGPIAESIFGGNCRALQHTVTGVTATCPGHGRSTTEAVHRLVAQTLHGAEFSITYRPTRDGVDGAAVGRSLVPLTSGFTSVMARAHALQTRASVPASAAGCAAMPTRHQHLCGQQIRNKAPPTSFRGVPIIDFAERGRTTVDDRVEPEILDNLYLSGAISTGATTQFTATELSDTTARCASALIALVAEECTPAPQSPLSEILPPQSPSSELSEHRVHTQLASTPAPTNMTNIRTPSLFSPSPSQDQSIRPSTRGKRKATSVMHRTACHRRVHAEQTQTHDRTLQLFEESPAPRPAGKQRRMSTLRRSAAPNPERVATRHPFVSTSTTAMDQTLQLFEDTPSPTASIDLSRTLLLFSCSPPCTYSPNETIQLFPHLDAIDTEKEIWIRQHLFPA